MGGSKRRPSQASQSQNNRVIPDLEGDTPAPQTRRDGRRLGKGQEGREEKEGMHGESGAKWRSREQGAQRGRRSPLAPAQNQRRRTGVRSLRCRGGMRGVRRGGCQGRSGVGGRGRWQIWSAT